MSNRGEILEQLRKRVRELESDCRSLGETVTTGCDDLDLLTGGLERGSLVEWIGSPGSGATTLALKAAQAACERRVLVVLDAKGRFNPPAAHALGIDLNRTVVVRPNNTKDFDWSLIQILRSTGVAAVVCWPDKTNEKMLRRWQLAAEHGQTLGFLVRPLAALREPSWARVRLLVEAQPAAHRERRWRITITGSLRNDHLDLEMNDETGELRKAGPLPVASPMVDPADLQRSFGT